MNIQQPKSIFVLLDEAYQDFKPGKTRLKLSTFWQSQGWLGEALAVLLVCLCLSLLLTADYLNKYPLTGSNIAGNPLLVCFAGNGLLLLVSFYLIVRSWRRWQSFNKYAQLLDGSIESASQSDYKGTARWQIVYRFQSPGGAWLGRTLERDAASLQRSIPPKAGMRVQILYVDDATYLVL
jgi:hypothetical protein